MTRAEAVEALIIAADDYAFASKSLATANELYTIALNGRPRPGCVKGLQEAGSEVSKAHEACKEAAARQTDRLHKLEAAAIAFTL